MRTNQSLRPIAVLAVAMALGQVSTYVNASEARIARYSELLLLPSETQRDPLMSPVLAPVPGELTRVGDAVEWLLGPSGYRLSAATAAASERSMLLALPLPIAHRSVEALPVRTALQTLAGPAFRLVEDPVHRLISFEPCVFASGRR